MMYRFTAIALAMVWCAWPASSLAAEPTEPADREAELRELREANQALTQQVAELQAVIESLRAELSVLKQANRSITAESQELQAQTIELKAEVDAAAIDEDAEAQAARLVSEYDAEADRTVWTFGPEPIEAEGSPGAFHFSVVFAHPGEVFAAVDQATLFIQTARAGRVFHDQSEADFEVDGEVLTIPIADVQVNNRRMGRSRSDRSDETVRLLLDRQTLVRLGQSKALVLREGRTVVTFDRDDRAALRAIAKRMGGD